MCCSSLSLLSVHLYPVPIVSLLRILAGCFLGQLIVVVTSYNGMNVGFTFSILTWTLKQRCTFKHQSEKRLHMCSSNNKHSWCYRSYSLSPVICRPPLPCSGMHAVKISQVYAIIPNTILHEKCLHVLECPISSGGLYHAMCTCRTLAFMLLATLLAVIAKQTTATNVSSTDDGMSVPGMFFAKLHSVRAQRMSQAHGKVCLRAGIHCT
jgi:hypothetical protein